MSEPVQATIIAVGALAVAMGPLVYAIGGIVKAAVALKAFFASLAGMTVTAAGLVVGLKALAVAVVALAVIGGITALVHKWGSEAREAAERTVELAKALEEAKQAFQELDADTASRAVLQFSNAMVDLTAQIDAQREAIAELEQAGLGDYEFQQLKQARAELEGMIQRRNELNQLYQAAAARLQTIRDGEQAVTAAAEGQLGTRREISRELEMQEVSLVNVRTTLTGLLGIEAQLTRQLQDRTMLLTQRAKLEGELRTVQSEINGIFRTQMGLLRDVQATMTGISQTQKASLDDLLRGLELNTLTAQEMEQILQIEEGIRLTLAAGVSDLAERNALTEILLRLQGELGRAGEEAAYKTRDAWSQVLGFISSRVDGIIASFAQIGQQLMSGNIVGAGLGLLGTGLDALGIGKGSREAAQAQERYNAALQRFVDMSRELTTFETGLRQIEDAFRQTVQSLMASVSGLQMGRGFDPTQFSSQQIEAFLNQLGRKAPPAVRAFFEELLRLTQIFEESTESLRQRVAAEIAATEQDLQVRLLRAQGLDREAEALQQALQFERERQDLIAKYGDEAATLVALIDEIERLTVARREEIAATQAAQALKDFTADIAMLKAVLADDKITQATIRIEKDVQRQLDAFQKLFEAGTITAEQLAEAQALLADYTAKAIADYTASLRDNAAAAREAESATRSNTRALWESAMAAQFQAQVEMANLQMRLLRAQGLDYEAARLSAHIELQRAVNDGRSAEYIRMLQQVQAYELAAQAQRKATQAAKETTKAIQDTSRILNAPTGFRNALLRWRIAGGTATNPLGGSQTGFLAGTTPAAGGSGQTIIINIADISLPNVTNAQQFLSEIVTEANRYARAGGGNVFQDLSEA